MVNDIPMMAMTTIASIRVRAALMRFPRHADASGIIGLTGIGWGCPSNVPVANSSATAAASADSKQFSKGQSRWGNHRMRQKEPQPQTGK
jgi:hypothetical protein